MQLKEGIWQRLLSSGPGPASRQDILNVLSSVEAILVRAFFHTRTASTRISDVFLDTAVEQRTGQSPVTDIEICRCPEGFKGKSCEVNYILSNFISGMLYYNYQMFCFLAATNMLSMCFFLS